MEEDVSYYIFRANDFYLVPLCLLVLYFFVFNIRKKYKGTPVQKYILPAVTLHFVCAIVYALVIAFYYGFGDSHNYYQGILDMHRAVNDDASNLKEIYGALDLDKNGPIYNYFYYNPIGVTHYYMLEVRNYTVSRFGLPFSILFNRSFLCISFCISYFSFLGTWRIFRLFYQMYPHLHKKIAYSCLFLPSLLFWGSSLLKDPICMGAMGYFLYAAHSLFIKRKKVIASIIVIFLTGFLLLYTKPYILLCLSAVFSLWIFLRFRDRIRDRTLRSISTVLFAAMASGAGFFLSQGLAQSETTAQFSADKLVQTVQSQQNSFSVYEEGSGSSFSVGEQSEDKSIFSLVSLFPLGVVNTFFRPFLWDVRSPIMIFSALEAFAFLALTLFCLRRVGFGKTFSIIFNDPVIAFCFVFALFFGGIIGVTTINFGALVRYKLPCIPFYTLAFFLVMDKSGKFSPNYVFGKKLF